MKIIIVTGMSGAGKSTALNVLEDEGYYCVDNMPISLMPKFAELADGHNQDKGYNNIALGILFYVPVFHLTAIRCLGKPLCNSIGKCN